MLEKIRKYKLISGSFVVSAIFVLAGFVRAMITLQKIGSPFIVHFNDMQGITSVSGIGVILFAGIFGIAVVLLNGSIALEFEEQNTFFGRLIAALTLVFAVLLFIAFTAILSVN